MRERQEQSPSFDDPVLAAYRAGNLPDLQVVCVVDEGMCATCCGVIRARVLRGRSGAGVYVDRRCECPPQARTVS